MGVTLSQTIERVKTWVEIPMFKEILFGGIKNYLELDIESVI